MVKLNGVQLLCVAMVTAGTAVLGLPPIPQCQLERQRILSGKQSPPIGAFVPQCDSNGQYTPQQCHGSTGYCWCVDVYTGQEIPNTKTPPGVPSVDCTRPADPGQPPLTTCQQAKNTLLGWRGNVAPSAYFPKCDKNGLYTAQQCYGSSGFCWCVEPSSGQEVPNTRNKPGEKPVDCSRPADPAQPQQTQCQQERDKYLGNKDPSIGGILPRCDSNGLYTPQQCNGPSCWCVDPSSGQEIPDTSNPSSAQPVDCGKPADRVNPSLTKCQKERQRNQPPGAFVPQCDSKGQYTPKQCHGSTGYCWCVNPSSGQEIPNTKAGPGGKPVNCQ